MLITEETGGGEGGHAGIYGNSVLLAQFFCKPQTAQKQSLNLKKKSTGEFGPISSETQYT